MWFVLFGAFGTVWLPYKTPCKTGRSGAKVRAMKSFRNFSQRTHPIHPFGPLPHVLVCFVLFGCIWDSLLRYNTQFQTGQTCAKDCAPSRVGFFRNERTRSTPLDSKLMFWCVSYYLGAFWTVWVRYNTQCKTGQTGAKVLAPKSRRKFSQRMRPIHPMGP